MPDIDHTLSQLAAAPAPSALAAIDDAVMLRLALRGAQIPAHAFGLAAVVSLLVGIAGAGVPATAGLASVTPFGIPSALAPSSLLASRQ